MQPGASIGGVLSGDASSALELLPSDLLRRCLRGLPPSNGGSGCVALQLGCSFPTDDDPADEPHRRCSCSVSHLRDAARAVYWPASLHRGSPLPSMGFVATAVAASGFQRCRPAALQRKFTTSFALQTRERRHAKFSNVSTRHLVADAVSVEKSGLRLAGLRRGIAAVFARVRAAFGGA